MKVAGTAASALKKNEEAIQYLEKYLELSPNAKDAAQMKYTIAATAQIMDDKEKAGMPLSVLKPETRQRSTMTGCWRCFPDNSGKAQDCSGLS